MAGNRQAQGLKQQVESLYLNPQAESRENELEMETGFLLSNPALSDIFPPAKLHFPNLAKPHQLLGTKY